MRPISLMGTLAAIITMSTFAPALAAEGPGGTVALSPTAGGLKCAPGQCESRGPRGGFMAQLNLSDDQLERFHAIRTKFQTDTAIKQAELKVLGIQLREILSAEKIDKQGAASVQSKINNLKADLANARLSSMIEKAEVFTPEQRKELHHRMLQREGAFGGHHGGRGGSHHGGGQWSHRG